MNKFIENCDILHDVKVIDNLILHYNTFGVLDRRSAIDLIQKIHSINTVVRIFDTLSNIQAQDNFIPFDSATDLQLVCELNRLQRILIANIGKNSTDELQKR